MTAESERGTSETGVDDESTPTPIGTRNNYIDSPIDAFSEARESSSADESPESLRYRADSLLDEMMLSAVDVSAADYGTPSNTAAFEADPGPFDADDSFGINTFDAGQSHSQLSQTPGSNGSGSHESGMNGDGASRPDLGSYDVTQAKSNSEPAQSGLTVHGGFESANGTSDPQASLASQNTAYAGDDVGQRQNGSTGEEVTTQTTPEWRVKTGGGGEGETAAWNEYVSSFRSPTTSSGQIQKWQPNSPADGFAPSESTTDENSIPTSDAGSDSETAQVSGTAQGMGSERSSVASVDSDEGRGAGGGTGYVSAMAVMPTGPRRSALLPRMSRFDIDGLNREIAELHDEIRALLPVGHDQAERAQHLLDKAHTIADSDPERSAEVEYYMQQVRTIVERTRESRRWSDLYRDRLRTYLLAWALLSTMTLTALWLSQFQIEAFVSGVMGAAQDAIFMRNFAGALGSLMAGALGSALGSLINMRKHAHSQYGFFDRKYGLRGLTLPIIGAVVGLLIYSVFAVVYHFIGINPSLSVVAMAAPALLAFVFGFSQESLYGTND